MGLGSDPWLENQDSTYWGLTKPLWLNCSTHVLRNPEKDHSPQQRPSTEKKTKQKQKNSLVGIIMLWNVIQEQLRFETNGSLEPVLWLGEWLSWQKVEEVGSSK